MSVNIHALTIKHHWETIKTVHCVADDKELPSHLLREAEFAHVYSVVDALLEIHMMAVSLSGGQLGDEAAEQLGRGFGRRTKFIWLSVRELLNKIPPSHDRPLSIETAEEAAKALNEIYINIRGSMDNLARCLLASKVGFPSDKQLLPIQVELFSSKFLKCISDPKLIEFIDGFRNWNKELKDRRDPAAHRLPLFVPQAIQDKETYKKHVEARRAYLEANEILLASLSRGDYNAEQIANAEKLREELLSIGKFHPLFTYDERIGYMAIYPTVPEDIGKLVMIGRGILKVIASQMGLAA